MKDRDSKLLEEAYEQQVAGNSAATETQIIDALKNAFIAGPAATRRNKQKNWLIG